MLKKYGNTCWTHFLDRTDTFYVSNIHFANKSNFTSLLTRIFLQQSELQMSSNHDCYENFNLKL